MPARSSPGVYREDIFLPPAPELRTGVPAILGYASAQAAVNTPQPLTLWPQFERDFGAPQANRYLAYAVRGFFANGGRLCYVVALDDGLLALDALQKGLDAIEPLDTVDLVCAPDIMRPRESGTQGPADNDTLAMQAAVLAHCDRMGDRFAILDAPPHNRQVQGRRATIEDARSRRRQLAGNDGALYYPWIRVADGPGWTWNRGFVPPCGHIAGIYARSDERYGVHKAPANERIEEALDLEIGLSDTEGGLLNEENINCLRAFPGRGIRVWGARTLGRDPSWTYVNVRRLFLTAARWIERNLAGTPFEPHESRLWARITRELNAYFTGLYRRGALKGSSPEEAFYVRCDAETNPPEGREEGRVVTEIGLAPGIPNEFVVVRIVHGAGGASITGPARPGT